MLSINLFFTSLELKPPLPYKIRGLVLSAGRQCGLNWLELLGSGGDTRIYMTIRYSMNRLESGDGVQALPLMRVLHG